VRKRENGETESEHSRDGENERAKEVRRLHLRWKWKKQAGVETSALVEEISTVFKNVFKRIQKAKFGHEKAVREV
jgi:hypothetical protein